MNKRILGIAVTILLSLMITASVSPVFAEVSTPNSWYTLITGKLGGADYAIYMPNNWNGKLVMGCAGYNFFSDPHQELSFDALAQWLTSIGYAFASTNYNGGERAWLVKEGIIRTHQLTQYIIDNYHVTGKIFLMGASMGGMIALDLANKYPNLYSGVLDICGAKDHYTSAAYSNMWTTLPIAQLRVLLNIPDAVPDSELNNVKIFFTIVAADSIKAHGGTIEEKPQAYEREDPLFHPNLYVPTISLLGAIDPLVIPLQHLNYQAAVTAAGCSSLYRQYFVPNVGHLDQPIWEQVPYKLIELFAWSDNLDD